MDRTQPGVTRLRALQLLPFYRGIVYSRGDAMGFPTLSMVHALELSAMQSTTSVISQLGKHDVKRWVSYWRTSGLLSKT